MSPPRSLLTLLALGLALLVAAGARPVPALRAAPAEPATTPLPGGLSVDGYVNGFTPAGDTLYVHGDFSYLGEPVNGLTVLDNNGRLPRGAPRGEQSPSFGYAGRILADEAGGWFVASTSSSPPNTYSVSRMSADMQPGGWSTSADGPVNDLALRGDTLYVSGRFSTIGGQARAGLAALDTTSGAVRPWTAAGASGSYTRIAASETTLYAVTDSRTFAAFATDTGAARSWTPAIDGGTVYRMLVDEGRVYLAGTVTNYGPDQRYSTADDANGLVVLDANSGAALGPRVQAPGPGYYWSVRDIALSADTIYLAGDFPSVNGQPRKGIAAVDRTTGELRPLRADLEYGHSPQAPQEEIAYALSLDGDTLYIGGVFEWAGGQIRRNIVALHATTGELLPWRGSVNNGVQSLAAANGRVAIGGVFKLAGGAASTDIAAIDTSSGQARIWEASLTTGTTMGGFGDNTWEIPFATILGDRIYVRDNDYYQSRVQLAGIHLQTAAAEPWTGVADAFGALATGDGKVIVTHRASETTAIVAAYDPFGTARRWERTVVGNFVQELLVAGDTLYGVANTYDSATKTWSGSVFALQLADGAFRWQLPTQGQGMALALMGGALYLGGKFNRVGEIAASNLIPLDAATGAPLTWPPALAPNGTVLDLAVDAGRLYLGGSFSAVGASPRLGLAAIDLAGAPSLAGWNPQLPPDILFVSALAITDTNLYVGLYPLITAGSNRYGMLVFPLSRPEPTGTPSPTAPATTGTTTTPPTAETHTPASSPSPTASGTPAGSPTDAAGTSTVTRTATPGTTATAGGTPTGTAVPADPRPHRAYLPLLR